MSGGRYNYDQFKILQIAEYIQSVINRQGEAMPPKYHWEEEQTYETFSPEVEKRLIEGIDALKRAYVYAQRIDWFLSGDDGEDNFLRRLEEDLKPQNL